jgi:hypothetical protein
MGRASGTREEMENAYTYLNDGATDRSYHLRYLGVYGRTILKQVLKKQGVRVLTAFI